MKGKGELCSLAESEVERVSMVSVERVRATSTTGPAGRARKRKRAKAESQPSPRETHNRIRCSSPIRDQS